MTLRKNEKSLRKNEMTLRKNEMELPKYSSVSQWKMKNLHEGIRRFLRGDLDKLTLRLLQQSHFIFVRQPQ